MPEIGQNRSSNPQALYPLPTTGRVSALALPCRKSTSPLVGEVGRGDFLEFAA